MERGGVMRRLATVAFAFAAAVLAAQYISAGAWLYWAAAALVSLAFLGFLVKTGLRLRLFLILPALAAGLLWSAAYRQFALAPVQQLEGTTTYVEAVVAGNPKTADYGSKVPVRILPNDNGVPCRPVTALLYIYGETCQAEAGSTIRFTARFRLADTMYGEETRSYFADGIYLIASGKSAVELTDKPLSPMYVPARVAGSVSAMIGRIFPPEFTGFVRALLLGDTTELSRDPSLSSALKTTGTWHIVSVSGMNIAFLMSLLTVFIKKKRLLSVIAIPVIFFFVAFVGFSPSVTRAGLMQLFVLLAPLVRRESDPLTSLSAALLILLLINPFAAGSAGLQLSFAATLGILLFTERLYTPADERLSRTPLYKFRLLRKLTRILLGGAAAAPGALVFTVPLTALHFGTVSLIAPLANIIILYAVLLAFYAGAAAVVLGFIYAPAGVVAALAAALPVRFISSAAGWLAGMPFASVYTHNTAIVVWLVFVYLALITVRLRRVRLRGLVIPCCAGVFLLCVSLVLTSVFGYRQTLTMTVLDVGQGQCVVIEDGAFTAVVDCGSLGSDAGSVLTGYLQSAGRLRIDLLVLTHYHEDHAGDIPAILERLPVRSVALPDPSIDGGPLTETILSLADRKGIELIVVEEALSVTAAGLGIRLYEPLGSAGENERGLAVLCQSGSYEALITGDMSAAGERRLIETFDLPDIELLVAGHHGSKHSTADELLAALRPEIAVISVGYNSYGHPSEETLRRLAANGSTVYRTDINGSITIKAH
jgi:competence protein ComEC